MKYTVSEFAQSINRSETYVRQMCNGTKTGASKTPAKLPPGYVAMRRGSRLVIDDQREIKPASKPYKELVAHWTEQLVDADPTTDRRLIKARLIDLFEFLERAYVSTIADDHMVHISLDLFHTGRIKKRVVVKAVTDLQILRATFPKSEQPIARVLMEAWRIHAYEKNTGKQARSTIKYEFLRAGDDGTNRICLSCGSGFVAKRPTSDRRFCPPPEQGVRELCNDRYLSWITSLASQPTMSRLGGQIARRYEQIQPTVRESIKKFAARNKD